MALTGEINLGAISGPVGMRVTIFGTGFTDNSLVTVHFGSVDLVPADNRVDITSFSTFFYVPNLPAGTYAVSATTDAGDTSNAKNFKIEVVIDPVITISSASGFVGNQVTVSGSGFTESSTARILFDGNILGEPVTTDSGGVLADTAVTVPETFGGSHTFAARDAGGTTSPALSYVVSPQITINPTSGGVGDQVTVSGNGFGAAQNLAVYFDTNTLVVPSLVASAQGVLPSGLVFDVPSTSRGSHTVEGLD